MKKLIFLTTLILASPLWGDGRTTAQIANEPGSGNCLSFNGVSNYIGFTNETNFDLLEDITVSAWIYCSSFSGAYILAKTNPSSCSAVDHTYQFSVGSSGKINFVRGDGVGFVIATHSQTLSSNTWYHVTAVHDIAGGIIRLYVNGVEESFNVTPMSMAVNNSGNLIIGATFACSNAMLGPFPGNIDEVAIWNRALTQTEIRDNMCKKLPNNYGNGLVGYWRFDEGTDNTCSGGQDVCDASGNGNNGVKF